MADRSVSRSISQSVVPTVTGFGNHFLSMVGQSVGRLAG
jgi:hypothetical protein